MLEMQEQKNTLLALKRSNMQILLERYAYSEIGGTLILI